MKVNPEHNAWAWARFVEALDKAGYAIVQKPTIEKGKPSTLPR